MFYILINVFNFKLRIVGYLINEFSSTLEEFVVEIDDVVPAAPIGFQFIKFRFNPVELFLNSIEDAPIAIPPAINTLLDVSHEKVVSTCCLVIDQKCLEILPLQAACVLKLINHDVVKPCACLFINKRCVAGLQLFQQNRCLAEVELVVFRIDASNLILDCAEQTQGIDVLA